MLMILRQSVRIISRSSILIGDRDRGDLIDWGEGTWRVCCS